MVVIGCKNSTRLFPWSCYASNQRCESMRRPSTLAITDKNEVDINLSRATCVLDKALIFLHFTEHMHRYRFGRVHAIVADCSRAYTSEYEIVSFYPDEEEISEWVEHRLQMIRNK